MLFLAAFCFVVAQPFYSHEFYTVAVALGGAGVAFIVSDLVGYLE